MPKTHTKIQCQIKKKRKKEKKTLNGTSSNQI